MGNKIDFNKKWFLAQTVSVRAESRTFIFTCIKSGGFDFAQPDNTFAQHDTEFATNDGLCF